METIKETAANAANTVKRTLGPAPSPDAYLKWDSPGVETVKPDEEAKAQKIADTMNAMQRHNFDQVDLPKPTPI